MRVGGGGGGLDQLIAGSDDSGPGDDGAGGVGDGSLDGPGSLLGVGSGKKGEGEQTKTEGGGDVAEFLRAWERHVCLYLSKSSHRPESPSGGRFPVSIFGPYLADRDISTGWLGRDRQVLFRHTSSVSAVGQVPLGRPAS